MCLIRSTGSATRTSGASATRAASGGTASLTRCQCPRRSSSRARIARSSATSALRGSYAAFRCSSLFDLATHLTTPSRSQCLIKRRIRRSRYHSFCVGFQSREALPSEDIEWVCPICAGVLRPEAPAHSRQQPPAAAAEHRTAAVAQAAATARREAAAAAAEHRAGTAESPVIADAPKKRRRRSSPQLSDDGGAGDEDDQEADSRQAARAAAAVSAAEPSRPGRARYCPRDRADTSAEQQATSPRISLKNARRAAAAAARRAVQVSEGQSLSDRGSTFQALLAPCTSIGSTETTLRAIAARAISATTRSYAWRITETNDEDGSMEIVERYDDGGEHGAGERLLQLLQRADVRNVCLVVARWFGANHSGDS